MPNALANHEFLRDRFENSFSGVQLFEQRLSKISPRIRLVSAAKHRSPWPPDLKEAQASHGGCRLQHKTLPFGMPVLDIALPGGGLGLGCLHEVIEAGPAAEYAATSALFVAGILARLGGPAPTAYAPEPMAGSGAALPSAAEC